MYYGGHHNALSPPSLGHLFRRHIVCHGDLSIYLTSSTHFTSRTRKPFRYFAIMPPVTRRSAKPVYIPSKSPPKCTKRRKRAAEDDSESDHPRRRNKKVRCQPPPAEGESHVPSPTLSQEQLKRWRRLNDDPLVRRVVNELHVECKTCDQTIKLSENSLYDWYKWGRHRRKCLQNRSLTALNARRKGIRRARAAEPPQRDNVETSKPSSSASLPYPPEDTAQYVDHGGDRSVVAVESSRSQSEPVTPKTAQDDCEITVMAPQGYASDMPTDATVVLMHTPPSPRLQHNPHTGDTSPHRSHSVTGAEVPLSLLPAVDAPTVYPDSDESSLWNWNALRSPEATCRSLTPCPRLVPCAWPLQGGEEDDEVADGHADQEEYTLLLTTDAVSNPYSLLSPQERDAVDALVYSRQISPMR
ncbi:hypothetical protein C8Q76DRAFT_715996 [Earliella scabrosa]|nr:hypothetical protein C8Q76DRAFT_715996 [Earliella scabrosa]